MKMIPNIPDETGAYYFHESTMTWLPEGSLLWPNDLPTDKFFEHNGMIVPVVEEIDGVPTVVSYEPNTEAWEAFLASMPDNTVPDVENVYIPTPEEQIRADVDYLAAMMGVEL